MTIGDYTFIKEAPQRHIFYSLMWQQLQLHENAHARKLYKLLLKNKAETVFVARDGRTIGFIIYQRNAIPEILAKLRPPPRGWKTIHFLGLFSWTTPVDLHVPVEILSAFSYIFAPCYVWLVLHVDDPLVKQLNHLGFEIINQINESVYLLYQSELKKRRQR